MRQRGNVGEGLAPSRPWGLGPGSWVDDHDLAEARPGGPKGDGGRFNPSIQLSVIHQRVVFDTDVIVDFVELEDLTQGLLPKKDWICWCPIRVWSTSW